MSDTDARRPKRIQRKRTKGWRMPEGAVYVGRPTPWGNPFHVGARDAYWTGPGFGSPFRPDPIPTMDAEHVTAIYRNMVIELRGKDLVCWCPLDQPCHADVLLEIANEPAWAGVNP